MKCASLYIGGVETPAANAAYQQSQSFGQRFMGNMMDNLLLRSFTSRSKSRGEETLIPSSPMKVFSVQLLTIKFYLICILVTAKPWYISFLQNYIMMQRHDPTHAPAQGGPGNANACVAQLEALAVDQPVIFN